ncbi:putative bifunctional diguanylate cyclase/phosphodiesterase [Blastococcus mobilis]|uniref:PAS domain S-box-containing protein/diguanylate cyclase (GGDEF) domain-containing protein n=1 Tax=Blastococcus mobilis TaxID=1938746 RepID=A0A238X258_9ACTN|nr:EAL domain-containing protein [Blastococcus mobilis]SNR52633.1 PAS domain S-box-containing protein/diguanylate cyclase (GGDEF) domain-containing protein [Blastococcus mobilis]
MVEQTAPEPPPSGVYESMFLHGIDGFLFATEDGRILRANPRACELLGRSEADLIEHGRDGLTDPRDHRWAEAVERRRQTGAFRGVLRLLRGDGSTFSAEVSSAVLPDAAGVYVSFRDLTAEEAEAARTAETRRAAAEVIDSLESISDMYVGVDADWRVTYINAPAETRVGVCREDVVGGDLWEQFPTLVGSVFEAPYRRVMDTGEPVTLENFYAAADLWTEVRVYPLRRGGIGIYFRDIAERKALELEREQLLLAEQESRRAAEQARVEAAYQAVHDELTGLLNRAGLIQQVDSYLACWPASSLTVLVIDLDRFKVVNDSLGHRTGDELLTVYAQRLATLAGPTDLVARLGGDEFVVAMFGASAAEADRMAEAVLAAARQPVEVGASLLVTASVGLAGTADAGAADPPVVWDVLLREADAAMYRAKETGRDQAVWFDEQMYLQSMRRMQTEHDLRLALQHDELFLDYQPAFDLRCERIDHVEALVRWRHPTRGLVPPLDFIPVAEDSGLIHQLGEWVLARAVEQAERWAHIPDMRVWINVSPQQLAHCGFPELIATHLNRVGLPGFHLGIEVTESTLADRDSLTTVLQEIRQLGVAVAIDDFGTGYSSLARLSTFPVDVIKIDRSFVADVETPRGETVLAGIVTLAHATGAHVIAEGVETEAQLAALSALGVDSASGYLLARPAAPEHLPLPDAGHSPLEQRHGLHPRLQYLLGELATPRPGE